MYAIPIELIGMYRRSSVVCRVLERGCEKCEGIEEHFLCYLFHLKRGI